MKRFQVVVILLVLIGCSEEPETLLAEKTFDVGEHSIKVVVSKQGDVFWFAVDQRGPDPYYSKDKTIISEAEPKETKPRISQGPDGEIEIQIGTHRFVLNRETHRWEWE